MTVFKRVLAALTGLVAAQLISVTAHAAPPLGKQNWVVSAAGFRTDAYRNYLRLGYIVFNPTSNAVEHNARIALGSCDTSRIVIPLSCISRMRRIQRC